MSTTDALTIGSIIRYRGNYDANATYYTNNQVTMCNCVFLAVGNNFSGIPPIEENTDGSVKLANTSTWKCLIDNSSLYNAYLSPNNFENRVSSLEQEITDINSNAEELDTKISNVIGTVNVLELDTWPATRADAIKLTLDAAHSRWALVDSVGRNVGLLDIFSDITKCQLTELLTSHFIVNSNGVLDFRTHKDGAITQFYRCYNIAASHLPNEQGTWGDWQEFIPNTISTKFASLGTLTESLQTEIDTEVSDRQTAVTEVQTNLDTFIAQKGVANGFASLDANGKVPSENITETQEVVVFERTVNGVANVNISYMANVVGVAFDMKTQRFYGYTGTMLSPKYYDSWGTESVYQDINHIPKNDTIFIDKSALVPYMWDEGNEVMIQIAAQNRPATVFNPTAEFPITGYYALCNEDNTDKSAVHVALENGKELLGLIITFLESANTWKTYQFVGLDTDEATFCNTENWKEFGAGAKMVALKQAEYDALVEAGAIDENTYYNIIDG